MCPMRFNKFPLDEHTCKFTVGSSNYDASRMTFGTQKYEIVVVAVYCRNPYPIQPVSALRMLGNYPLRRPQVTVVRKPHPIHALGVIDIPQGVPGVRIYAAIRQMRDDQRAVERWGPPVSHPSVPTP